MGYARGWTSPLSYANPGNVINEIIRFIRKTEPDIAGLVEIHLGNEQFDSLKKHFRFSNASCKYAHKTLPFVRCWGNAVFSNKACSITHHYLNAGQKKLVLDCEFAKFRLLLVHLSLIRRAREKQIQELAGIAGKNTIIAGDFNIKSQHELEQLTRKGFKTTVTRPTFPSWKPVHFYDQVLVPKNIDAKAQVLDVKLSDHLPVVVEIS